MDKKFLLKAILLNTAWVAWIVLSIFLGYIIYREAFPDLPVVIIPFSLLFLVVGGAAAYFVNKFIKKRKINKTAAANIEEGAANGSSFDSADGVGKPTERGDNIISESTEKSLKDKTDD